jgi:hypothetical protein
VSGFILFVDIAGSVLRNTKGYYKASSYYDDTSSLYSLSGLNELREWLPWTAYGGVLGEAQEHRKAVGGPGNERRNGGTGGHIRYGNALQSTGGGSDT